MQILKQIPTHIPRPIPLYQAATATLAAALIAGAIVGFPGLPHATGTSQVTVEPLPAVPSPPGDPTAARGWPYSQHAGQVRLITTDRLP
ncbi:MAG TPA: hypothetical protein VNR11_16875 [Xanthobacteraceae bacterium]|nr:hypothetical protein [Xanthobacteraceae bacterium]